MITAPITDTHDFAATRLGEFGRNYQTAPTGPRTTLQDFALTRLGGFPKLPLQNCVSTRCSTPRPDWEEKSFHNFHNLNFLHQVNALATNSSCGGETTPYGGRRRAPAATPGASSSFHRSGVFARVFFDRRSNP